MLIKQDFEVLVNAHGVDNCNMKQLLKTSKDMAANWNNFIIANESETTSLTQSPKQAHFNIDENFNFNYITAQNEKRSVDISEFALGQLCSRVGVPASYIKKCVENGKINLALDNFQSWAADAKKNILVREHEGVARAILSDSYETFDSYKVLRALYNTVDDKIYEPSQVLLSTDKLHIRFVNHNPLPIDTDGSPLYAGFIVDSSDVGRGSLNMKFFIYRFACKNGTVVSKIGGTLFRQIHAGTSMSGGKIELFSNAFMNIDKLTDNAITLINENKKDFLKDYELNMYIEKAKRDLQLSVQSQEKLKELLDNTYDHSKWGLISSVSELAQNFTLDTRIEFENWAGDLLTQAA